MSAPLPEHAYIPGRTARHPPDRFEALRASASDPTSTGTAAGNAAFQAGLDFVEAGYFWEAHEVLEPVWMNAPANAPERFLVQAVIQLANAALKHRMGRPNATRRLCAMAEALLERAGPAGAHVMGLPVDGVRRAIGTLREAAGESAPVRILLRSQAAV